MPKINEEISANRNSIRKYIKGYIQKFKTLPPSDLHFYKFVKKIGNGAFGQVYLAIHKLTGKYVAIKMIESK